MNDRNAYSIWTLSFLAGGLAGATAALLLAPRSGRDTRNAMRRTLNETDASMRRLKHDVIRSGENLRDEATRRVGAAAAALAGNGSEAPASL